MSGLPKLTDWIDGRIKPTIPGVYQRRYQNATERFVWYARWDGSEWFSTGITPEQAQEITVRTAFQHLPWRGLAEPPQ